MDETSVQKKAILYRMVMPGHLCPFGLKSKDLLERNGYAVEDHPLTSREETEAFKAKLGESVNFPKRLGYPDELASMVLECVTNSYVNGETIRVDGAIRMPPK